MFSFEFYKFLQNKDLTGYRLSIASAFIPFPAGIYLVKDNNRNTKIMREMFI